MLCQFTFQNFKSYKNETTLDFQAAVLPEFKDTLITDAHASDLLPVNVIYGPNGGGKSNLLQALACVISTVVEPVNELGKTDRDLFFSRRSMQFPFCLMKLQKMNQSDSGFFFASIKTNTAIISH